LQDALKDQNNLDEKLLEKHKECQRLDDEHYQLMLKSSQLRAKTVELVTELKNLKISKKEIRTKTLNGCTSLEMLDSKLAKDVELVNVVRSVLYRLIHGSGVNWAQDPKLKGIVFALGKPYKS